jgi:uncharacterized protein (TIGR02270 family)
MVRIIPEIVGQHGEEAAFLWLLRDGAVRAAHYLLADLARLDNRIEAHLDGLRVCGDSGWEVCAEVLPKGDAGEIFAGAVVAFASGEDEPIQAALKADTAAPDKGRGLVSALGWLPFGQAQGPIKQLLAAEPPNLRQIGIAASAIHRQHPGDALVKAVADKDPALKARALRAMGELGLVNLHTELRKSFVDKDPACCFWANWSAALLRNDSNALANLQDKATMDGPFRQRAVQLVMRRLPVAAAKVWQQKLAATPEHLRLAVLGAGAIGDPALVPWLIDQMKVPALARVAGEALSTITGVHIAYDKLEGQKPEGFEAGPSENPADEDVAMDPDLDLAWPDPARVKAWWGGRQGQFPAGTRHLVGRPISPDWLTKVLRDGYQRQRAAAALELAISQPERGLFEVRAPGFRQQKLLNT